MLWPFAVLLFLLMLILAKVFLDDGLAVDKRWLAAAMAHRPPALTRFMLGLTRLFDLLVVVACVGIFLWQFLARKPRQAWVWLGLLGAGMLANAGLKMVVHRPRPDVVALVGANGYSFPSNHAAVATLVTLCLAGLVWQCFPAIRWRLATAVMALALIATVCYSRVCLGAHYPSDVLGGVLFATAWLQAGSLLLKRWSSTGGAASQA